MNPCISCTKQGGTEARMMPIIDNRRTRASSLRAAMSNILRWVVLFNQIDDSLSPRTSRLVARCACRASRPRVYKRNGVLIVWSLAQIKDGLILWLLWCMCMWVHTYICSCIIFNNFGLFSLFSLWAPQHVRSLPGKLTGTTKWWQRAIVGDQRSRSVAKIQWSWFTWLLGDSVQKAHAFWYANGEDDSRR